MFVHARLAKLVFAGALTLFAVSCRRVAAPLPTVPMPLATVRPRCEAVHALRGTTDRVDTRIERMEDGWLVSLRLHLELGDGIEPVDLYGLGRVRVIGSTPHCDVLDAGGQPGSARFDNDLCLDAVESIADLLDAAEISARPGQTVVEETRIERAPIRRRRRQRRRAQIDTVRIRESAMVTRDADGRPVSVVNESPNGTREYIDVHYAQQHDAHCVPTW